MTIRSANSLEEVSILMARTPFSLGVDCGVLTVDARWVIIDVSKYRFRFVMNQE
jgi:hypothetical protein